MVTVARDDHIADDWQDVADDDLSVVSLPTSLDASDDGDDDLVDMSPPAAYDPTIDISNSMSALLVHNRDSAPKDDEAASMDIVDNRGPPPDYLEHGPLEDAVPNLADERHELDANIDVDMDPTFLYKVITSLIKLISEIQSIVHFGGRHHERDGTLPARCKVEAVCKSLDQHLRTLVPIMEGYSKHWNPEQVTVDLPIDPYLYEWMSNLNVELLGLQNLFQGQLKRTPSNTLLGDSISNGLDQYSSTLGGFVDQIASFIPMMENDYAEFHTENLPIVNDVDAETTSAANDKLHRYGEMSPNTGVGRLRRELYSLKDQISACVTSMQTFVGMGTLIKNRQALFQVKESYISIKGLLDVLLSNHASEWIEHGLAGGLTYPEFCRLNPDTIRSLSLQLKELDDNMVIEHGHMLALRYAAADDADVLMDELEFSPSDHDALKVVEEVLASLLRVRNGRVRT